MGDSDIDSIMDIWFQSTVDAHPFIDLHYWEKSYEVVKREYLPQSKTLVFEEGGVIKGFISLIEEAFIGALFILPRYQHQGIGKKLLEAVFRHQSELTLAVYEENKNSVLFYKKIGFQIIDRQLNVDSGKAEYIMKKKGLNVVNPKS